MDDREQLSMGQRQLSRMFQEDTRDDLVMEKKAQY